MKAIVTITSLSLALLALSCDDSSKKNTPSQTNTTNTQPSYTKKTPEFNEQNAYYNVAAQVKFGSRVPGTSAHAQTAQWLEAELRKYTQHVTVHKTQLTAGDKKTSLPCF